MKILVLLGSLRGASFAKKLARAAEIAAPAGMSFELTDARDLPLYDQDIDGDQKPVAVQALVDRIEAADALLFITPEYNYGIPGSLKNAIDWASRPAFRSPIKDKPATIVAYSPAPAGGARVHLQLSSVLSGTLTWLMPGVSFVVGSVHEKFDESGQLIDEAVARRLGRQLEELSAWVARSA